MPGTLENAKLVVGGNGLELPTGKTLLFENRFSLLRIADLFPYLDGGIQLGAIASILGCSLQFSNELHHLSPIMVGQPGVNDTLDPGGLNPSSDIRLHVQGGHG